MPGTVPWALGIAAFASIKFSGYSLASMLLKRRERAIPARVVTIAATRTVIGFVPGPLATFLGAMLVEELLWHKPYSSCQRYSGYGLLLVTRILIGALVLFLFTLRTPLSKPNLWLYSALGAILSCLLEWPGYALAIAAPGQLTFC